MSNSSYRMLSETEAIKYVRNIPGLFSENAQLSCEEIGDGNLNLVFRIREYGSSIKSVIIKQALPYARVVGESWPLTLDRARIESEALMLQNSIIPGLVPKVYHYDKEFALTVMEDLSTHVSLRKGLITRNRYPDFAKHIGKFLARTLFLTSDLALDPQVKKQKVVQFINPEMCKITEDLVFTDPYNDAKTNHFNPLIKEVIEEIWSQRVLKLEIMKLKEKFLTNAQALIHGDLHTGSIMVTETDTKVFDPEFAFYGPMGYDIGAVIANLLLNFCSHVGHTPNRVDRHRYQDYLLNTIEEIWRVFEEEFRKLWQKKAKDQHQFTQEYKNDYLLRLLQDSIGYAGCKMMRRVIGLAHVPDLESIDDPKLRAKGERLALAIGQQLVLKRETVQKISDLSSLVNYVKNQEVDEISKFIQSIEWKNDQLILLDQSLLPEKTVFLKLTTIEEVWEAIRSLKVRGAPAIGMAAAYGLYLGVHSSQEENVNTFIEDLVKKSGYLATARPTAVNLFWALNRLKERAYQEQKQGSNVEFIKGVLLKEALQIQEEDEQVCRKIGENALNLFQDGMGILTHCNAGSLATAKYGTATAPFYIAKEQGWNLKIFADETRPVLQGARLTTWELKQAGIDVTLICDNMAAVVMANQSVQAVIVGTDRVAANGDVANKIGTYSVAILAKAHGLPFYVAAPISSIDLNTPTGKEIKIEERSEDEIIAGLGKRIAPQGIKVYNPAFDITPYSLITAFVTEKGIVYPDKAGQYTSILQNLI